MKWKVLEMIHPITIWWRSVCREFPVGDQEFNAMTQQFW